MFILNYTELNAPRAEIFDDIKDLADVVIGITGSVEEGRTADRVASNMTFGDEFISHLHFKIRCVTSEIAKMEEQVLNLV